MPIKITDPDALDRLQKKLNNRLEFQKQMKGINKICRNAKLSGEEKTKILAEKHKLSGETIQDLLSGRILGIPAYQLSGNNQEVNRLKKRIKEVIHYQSKVAEAANSGELPEVEFDGGSIVDNIPENRIQIFFDAKPDADVRAKLKMRGFRWAPSNNAWQSYRSGYNFEWARQEFSVKDSE